MAAATNNLSRRAVLGAGAALPVLFAGSGAADAAAFAVAAAGGHGAFPSAACMGAPPAAVARSAPSACCAWDRALARFRRADAAMAECRAEQGALPAALRAWPHSQALDDRLGRIADVRLAALRKLLRTPAPDLAALPPKIDLILDG